MREAIRSSVLPAVWLLLHGTAGAQVPSPGAGRAPAPQTETFADDARWVSAAHGAVPDGALAHGHESDGRLQYVCRAWDGSALHLGKVSRSSPGCAVVSRGRPVTLGSYQVLTEGDVHADRGRRETVVDLIRRRRAEGRQGR